MRDCQGLKGRILKLLSKRNISFLFTVLFVWLIFNKLDISKIFVYIKDCDWRYVALLLPVYAIDMIAKAKKWDYLLMHKKDLPFMTKEIVIGSMLNMYLPARAGDFYRAHSAGKHFNISKVTAFGSIALERITDGVIVFLMLLGIICFAFQQPWLIKVAVSSGIVFVGSFLMMYLISINNNHEKFFKLFKNIKNPKVKNCIEYCEKHFASFVSGLEVLNKPILMSKMFSLSICVWLIESFTIFLVIRALGVHLSFIVAIFVMCVSVFSSTIPSSSIFIGPYQYGYIMALGAFGVAKEKALAIALVNQAAVMLLITIAGLLFFLEKKMKFDELKEVVTE